MNHGGGGGSIPTERGPKLVKESGTYGKCVRCGITLNQERHPQLLPCLHSICQACLPTNKSEINKDVSLFPACPSCDLPFNILEVTDNVFLKNSSNELWNGNVKCTCCEGFVASGWCIECREALCSECVSAHRRVKVTRDHTILLQPPTGFPTPTKFCVTHRHEPIKLFCLTCNQLTCRDCQLMDHRNHSFQFLHEALVSQKEQLQLLVQRVWQQREAVKQSLQDMDGRLLDIIELKSKLRESLRRMLIATVQLLKSRAVSIYSYIENMFDSEVAGIETRRSALNRLRERQEYVADFAERALNVEDFFALLSSKSQIVTQLQHILSQNTAPPESMLSLQLVISDDFKKYVSSFCKVVGDIVPFAKSHVRKDESPRNPERTQESPNSPFDQNPSHVAPVPIHSVPPSHNPVLQVPCLSPAPPSLLNQPSTSQASRSQDQPLRNPSHSNPPVSSPVPPKTCLSTLAPSKPCLDPNPLCCVPSNPTPPADAPAGPVQSPLVPPDAQLSSVQSPTSPSAQPPTKATPRLYGKFKASPPPGSRQSRSGKNGKSWTFHAYSPGKHCFSPSPQSSSADTLNVPPRSAMVNSVPNLASSQTLTVALHPSRCQPLRILIGSPCVNPAPVLPVKALADSPCDRGLLPTSLSGQASEPDRPARENEPTSTVTEVDPGDRVVASACDGDVDVATGSTCSDLPLAVSLGGTVTHTDDGADRDRRLGEAKAIGPVSYTLNNWRTRMPTSFKEILLGSSSPSPTTAGSLVATEMPSRPPNTQSLTSTNGIHISTTFLQPRVSLFRIPISIPAPGCPLPQFLLVQGASKNEIILQEINDEQSHGDDNALSESEDLLWTKALSSPGTPPLLQCVSCAACRTVGGSLLCVSCGRGYHRDCHIPPIGPSFWEDWKCSLCQDLADDTDPYADDRPKTMCLNIADQRKCEHLLLFLRCENDTNVLCSPTEPPSDSICLDSIHGRLLQHRSPPYRTPSEFVSDVWVLLDNMLMNSKDQESCIKLRGSFQVELGAVFGTALHPSLLSSPGSSCVERGKAVRTEAPSAAETLKRMREFVNKIKVPKTMESLSSEDDMDKNTKRCRLSDAH
ncbi:E3 ubiquitin-protein ligase TRIM33 [Esox lucius]|uniref:Tripartite motif containing 33 n=1 Tax=Esox lucius TaxID=8010 RepID=A0A3P8ZQ68_ESOLU|nr:E3 ubiquitin-protein ligase TRIM33 [Esox lucius]